MNSARTATCASKNTTQLNTDSAAASGMDLYISYIHPLPKVETVALPVWCMRRCQNRKRQALPLPATKLTQRN